MSSWLRGARRHAGLDTLFVALCLLAWSRVRHGGDGGEGTAAAEASTCILLAAALGMAFHQDLLVCHWRSALLELLRRGDSLATLRRRLIVHCALRGVVGGGMASMLCLIVPLRSGQTSRDAALWILEPLALAALVGFGAGFLGSHRLGRDVRPGAAARDGEQACVGPGLRRTRAPTGSPPAPPPRPRSARKAARRRE